MTLRTQRLTYEEFRTTVTNGRIGTSAAGQQSVMPSFGNNPNVMDHLDDIYSYLKARADGAIGRGRPKRLPKAS